MRQPTSPQSSQAAKTGYTALGLAMVLAFPAPRLAILPLVIFVGLCLLAPFCPQWSFFLPVISRGPAGAQNIALTFDDGPSPHSTPALLALLAKYRLKATFFVTGCQAKAHPDLIRAILEDGHSLGNHSYFHDNLLMLKTTRTLEQDIRLTQQVLARAGVRPLFFRPPVGISNSKLGAVLNRQGLRALTFSCRIFDRGNRNVRNLAAKVLQRIRPGDILLLHDCPPEKGATAYWLDELDHLFQVFEQRQLVVPLEELIGQPVMTAANEPGNGALPI